MSITISDEVAYVILLFGLFIVPRILQRFGIPTAITGFALGAGAGMGFGLFAGDPTVSLLAALGIASLFLFAGLEVDFRELRRNIAVLLQHVLIQLTMLGGVAYFIQLLFGLEWRPAVLVALALVTPSAGFILDSLSALGSSPQESSWIRSKVIAVEIIALAVLFVDLRSETAMELTLSCAALLALIAVLPFAFRVFARLIVPYAPKSDFAFLIIVAVTCALITKALGVYYLVGAFLVGVVAQRFRAQMAATENEKMLHAVEALASLFVPFYFFYAGLQLRATDFSWMALLVGLGFLAAIVPLRLFSVGSHRHLALGESRRHGMRVAIPMLPTLVFTLVIAGILRAEFAISSMIYGGLVIYAVVTTMLPSLLHRAPPPEFDHLTARSMVLAPHQPDSVKPNE